MTSWPPTLPFRWAQVKKRSTSNSIFCHSFGVLFPKRLILKHLVGYFWRKKMVLVFSNGLICTHPCIFRRFLADISETVPLRWRKQTAFFSILGLDGSSPNSLGPPGTLWDPLGGSHRAPEEELKSEFNGKVARTIILNFPRIWGGPN